ncbi:uncharacterized protein LOC127281611 [Leptopilina boulardi]|uniref:uncharacterized protein LOC127281611 n=1 Tax=Leptopilina boulardi TaxID=63433 RepID=UPI0021F629F5|nr:uncharacterized protein LOC127281611 [Leptopilina boulardi]
MGLKLLILLLLLVMRSSLSEKADNHDKLANGIKKNHRFVQNNFSENFQDLEPKAIQEDDRHGYLNISTIMTPLNHQYRQSLWMKRKASILNKAEKSDRKSKKLRTVSANELEAKEEDDDDEEEEEEEKKEEYQEEITVMNERKKNTLSFVSTNSDQKNHWKVKSLHFKTRAKRQAQELWIQREFHGYDDILNLHAFIIRDEEIPQCGNSANKITNTRYFMCSGVILTKKFILTTASCIQYADIFEHHIEANLSVLIGAVSNQAYVIKVKKYEMHPEYKNIAESMDYALRNLAIITIACDIPTEVLSIPTFPARYEDVSHMCCSDTCKILTIIQTPTNRHKIQLMDAKYIPRAVHDDIVEINNSERRKKGISIVKKVKRENKIAPPPIFLNNESSKNTEIVDKKNSDNKTIRQLTNLTENGLMEKITEELMRGLFREKFSHNSNKLTMNNTEEIMRGFFRGNFDIDTNNNNNKNNGLSEEQTKAISKFIKVITEKAMSRVLSVIDEAKKNKTFPNSKEEGEIGENFVDNIAQIVKDNVLREIDGSLSPRNLFNNTLSEPSSKYIHCPPLGTPIIINKTLIGLVAYTCDDLQSWVPWQYVNIEKNLNWIKNTIKGHKNDFTKLQSTFDDDNDNVQILQESEKNDDEKINKYSDEEENGSTYMSDNVDERFKKDQQANLKLTDKKRRHYQNIIKPILTNF